MGAIASVCNQSEKVSELERQNKQLKDKMKKMEQQKSTPSKQQSDPRKIECEEEIRRLKEELLNKSSQTLKLQSMLDSKSSQSLKFQQVSKADVGSEKLQQKRREYEEEIKKLKKELENVGVEKIKLQSELQIKNTEKAKLQETYKTAVQNLKLQQKKELGNVVKELTDKLEEEKGKSAQKERQLKADLQTLAQIKQKSAKKQKELLSSLNKIQNDSSLSAQKEKELQDSLQKLQAISFSSAMKEKELQDALAKMRSKIEEAQRDKEELQANMQEMKEAMKKRQEELIKETKFSEEQKVSYVEQLLKLKKNTDAYELEIKAKDQKIEELNKNMKDLQSSKVKDIQHSDLRIEKLNFGSENSSRCTHFFNVGLLAEEIDYKEYLVATIESRYEKKIAKTKFLYQYDQLNKINIHRYIDYKYGLTVIIKLSNGFYLAGFSEGPFYPKMQSKYDGMIISLTNRRFFVPLQKNKRAIAYDDFFIIFGNSELRLKSQDKNVFSNFGINNGYYDSQGEKVDVLLGSGKTRELELKSYQFYEVTFLQ